MRILRSLHGRLVGLGADDRLMAPKGFRSGEDGSQFLHNSPSTVALVDEFLGKTMSSSLWTSHKGSDGGCVDWAITAAVDGQIAATTGAGAGATMAVNGVQVDSALNWQANSGDVMFETKVKMSQITTISVFVGLTNQVASLQAPIISAGAADTFTNNAADAVGFMFDTSMTTKNWWLTGVAGSTGATNQNSGGAPVAATYDVLRVELTKTGAAIFYRNGKQVGTQLAGAVTATVALTPVIAAFTRAAGSATMTASYIALGSLRI